MICMLSLEVVAMYVWLAYLAVRGAIHAWRNFVYIYFRILLYVWPRTPDVHVGADPRYICIYVAGAAD